MFVLSYVYAYQSMTVACVPCALRAPFEYLRMAGGAYDSQHSYMMTGLFENLYQMKPTAY